MGARNFVVLFDGREGTSPLMRLLDRFDAISIVHQVDQRGWEPFDDHNCGAMTLPDLIRCLDMVYDDAPLDLEGLNRLYTRTAVQPLAGFDKSKSVGFKMRFRPPAGQATDGKGFREAMLELLARCRVAVFVAVRQDLLRRALSIYHGDGSGRPGHIQFRLAMQEIRRDDIRPIRVDADRLATLIDQCAFQIEGKRRLVDELCRRGIPTKALRYEDFCADRVGYFRRLLRHLGLSLTDREIVRATESGAHFEKVHADDIASFVLNHEEISARFGDCHCPWPD